MDDLIIKQAAIEHFQRIIDATNTDSRYNLGFIDGLEFCINHLSTMPSVQPEQRKGKWIGKPIAGYATVRCSVCNDVFLGNEGRWNFCPNCGAEMEKENDDR